eukprot:UN00379
MENYGESRFDLRNYRCIQLSLLNENKKFILDIIQHSGLKVFQYQYKGDYSIKK